MKIRQGFVSNSSSSSFICGVAEIVDKKKFDDYIEKHNIVLNEYDMFVAFENSVGNGFRTIGDRVQVDSFCTEASAKRNKPGTMFFVVNIINNEGDGPFWNDAWGEYDYDIGPDYFDGSQRAAYDMFSSPESGLSMENNSIICGADRNG